MFYVGLLHAGMSATVLVKIKYKLTLLQCSKPPSCMFFQVSVFKNSLGLGCVLLLNWHLTVSCLRRIS